MTPADSAPADSVPAKKRKLSELQNSPQPLVMVTAYDYPSAQQAQAAAVELILVGDSLGNVILGYDSTTPVTLNDMAHHGKAARRGAPQTFLVLDMPFGSYLGSKGLDNALWLVQQTQADALKLEGSSPAVLELVRTLTSNGIPIMGHVGLMPQTASAQGGLTVQGKDEASATATLAGAKALEQAGAFAVILEAIPARLAALISQQLTVPTIGIGAGANCGGQVLVYHDLLGIYEGDHKKIAKRYAEVGQISRLALSEYAQEVRHGTFPSQANSFVIKDEVLDKLY